MLIRRPQPWEVSQSEVSSEAAYFTRRRWLKTGIAGGIAAALAPRLLAQDAASGEAGPGLYPARKNPAFKVGPLTDKTVAATYNNFYEFSTAKTRVHELVGGFVTDPWTIKVHGLVKKPLTLDLDDLLKKVQLEERIYRFRCVEAWAMVVPWTGFPLADLVKMVEPTNRAKYLRFVTFNRPKQAPGFKLYPYYEWPYHEGLTLAEATNPLTLLATGIYGAPMPKQHGAPIRLVTPWKYGYKSIKSVVEIEFVAEQPKTFWNSAAPDEYGFYSNVDPAVPHPRWSQAEERMIGTEDENGLPKMRKTEAYNGYAAQVAGLYKGLKDIK